MTLGELVIDDICWGYSPYKGHCHKGLYGILPRDEFEKVYFEMMCINDGIDIDSEEYKQWVELRKAEG